MARLWSSIDGRPWLVNPVRQRKGKRTRIHRKRRHRNPLGDELVVLGALAGNPRRKRKGVRRMKRRGSPKYHRRRSAPRHNRVRRHRVRHNPRVVYRYRHHRNPRHRRYRRNPDALAISVWRPGTWLPYGLTAGAAATAAAAAPKLFFGPTVTPMQAYLTQGGLAVAGAFALPLVGLKRAHGMVWFLTGVAIILADTIGRFAMQRVGLSAYPARELTYYPPRLSGADAYPYEYAGHMSAYESVPGAPVAPFDLPYGT